MNQQEQDLYLRICEMEIVPTGHTMSFARKLAKENAWDLSHALAAEQEYRKFLLMALVADHVVCPSEEVDAVWHLHMIYTRSYWEDFCRDIAGRPVHHQPSFGGCDETEKYRQLYQQTLATYQSLFAEEARADIWPDVATRFGRDTANVRINRNDYFLIPKPKWPNWLSTFWRPTKRSASQPVSDSALTEDSAAIKQQPDAISNVQSRPVPMASFAAPLLAMSFDQLNPLEMNGPDFLKLYVVLLILIGSAAFVARWLLAPSVDQHDVNRLASDKKLSIYDFAFLQGGAVNIANVALTKLLNEGAIEPNVVTGYYDAKLKVGKPADCDPFQRALLHASQSGGLRPSQVVKELRFETDSLRERLASMGLVESFQSLAMRRLVTTAMLGPLLAVGVSKISVGLDRERPVAFLVILVIATTIVWILSCVYGRVSGKGAAVLHRAREKHRDLETNNQFDGAKLKSATDHEPAGAYLGDHVMPLALFGALAFPELGLHPDSLSMLKQSGIAEQTMGSGGSGCGTDSGCGSGCGGGGCGGGGCGGCGG